MGMIAAAREGATFTWDWSATCWLLDQTVASIRLISGRTRRGRHLECVTISDSPIVPPSFGYHATGNDLPNLGWWAKSSIRTTDAKIDVLLAVQLELGVRQCYYQRILTYLLPISKRILLNR